VVVLHVSYEGDDNVYDNDDSEEEEVDGDDQSLGGGNGKIITHVNRREDVETEKERVRHTYRRIS
jgi:hypothetical protein